jgi:cytochrome P450
VNRAGQETTGTVLSWFVKYIATDLEIQRQLHDEVCNLFGYDLDDTVLINLETLDDDNKMPILEAVVTETLRCSMTAGVIARQCQLCSFANVLQSSVHLNAFQ